MESQDLFGVQSPSVIDDATASFLLGETGTVTSKPEEIQKIEDEKEEEFITPDKPVITEDDILGTPKEKEKPANTQESPTEEEESAETEVVEKYNYDALVRGLINLGVLTELQEGEEIKTEDDLAAKCQRDAELRANQTIYNILTERHGEEALKAFEAIYVNGIPPKEYFGQYNELQDLKSLDISVETNQEKVLQEFYRRQGLAEDKVAKKLERLRNYGDIEDEARDAYDILVQQEEEEFQEKLAIKAEEEKQRKLYQQQYNNNVQTILAEKLKSREFDGIPLTEKVARETADYLCTEKWKNAAGEKLTDFDKDILELKKPENHALKIKLALLLKNKLDLSKLKISNAQISKETKKLFDGLVTKEKTVKRNNPTHSSGSFI